MLISLGSQAQTNIQLNINHKLAEVDFALEIAAKNNMGHDFNVTRLEYYISEISLVHDGGNETKIEDLWILARANTTTEVDLGAHAITDVEKIKLHIGVDPDHNHLDPSMYHMSHPLAPKSPSMHWGWNAGYRFVALEGNGGSALNQLVQLHGLGDDNYFTTEVDLDLSAENGLIKIDLDADYTRALEDIALTSGVIVHGDNLQAQQSLENFRDFVFSASPLTSSTIDFSEVGHFSSFPNPIQNGITTLVLELKEKGFDYDLCITSMNGKELQYLKSVQDGQKISLVNYSSGVYFMNLIKGGQAIITNKLIVN